MPGGRRRGRGRCLVPSLVGVALAVRGSRSRLVGSVATLLVALVATAAATLGPLYAATGEDSLVRQRLAQVPAAQSGLVVSANLFDQSASVDRVVDRLALAAADSRYDGYWGAPSLAVQSSGRTVVTGRRGRRCRGGEACACRWRWSAAGARVMPRPAAWPRR